MASYQEQPGTRTVFLEGGSGYVAPSAEVGVRVIELDFESVVSGVVTTTHCPDVTYVDGMIEFFADLGYRLVGGRL